VIHREEHWGTNMAWYDLFKKLQNISEAFGRSKVMVHEEMPEELRQLVRGALYHLEPAKIMQVKTGVESGYGPQADKKWNVFDVYVRTYQKIDREMAEEYFDGIMVKQVGMEKSPTHFDPDQPRYQGQANDYILDLHIVYEPDDDDEPDEDKDDTDPGMEDMLGKFGAGKGGKGRRDDEDPEDWWKKGSDKYDPESWKK